MRYLLTALCALTLAASATAQPGATFDPRPSAGGAAATGADFTAPRLQNTFFTPVAYRGAFAPNAGGTAGRWDLPWANYNPQQADYGPTAGATVLEGSITTNLVLNASTRYLMRGFIYVRSGASLTIPAGTVLFGEQSSRGSIIVERGAQIFINGTAANPVIMTSAQPPGSRAAGDWGGLLILGRACINAANGEATIEGGVNSTYGGGAACNDDDNSGSVRYLRLEYSGIAFGPNNEINGITMGGVGRGTTMEYIQVSFNGDDAYEWFGGTVNGRYFISYGTLDDDLDGDIGWRGNVQFGLLVRDPNQFDTSGSTCLEQDNQTTESTAGPRSRPTFSNVTCLGPLVQTQATPNALFTRAAHFRRATQASIYNSVILGYPQAIRFDGPNTRADFGTGDITIQNSIIAGAISTNETGFDLAAGIAARPGNTLVALGSDGGAGAAGFPTAVSEEGAPGALEGFRLAAFPNPGVAGQQAIALDVPEATALRLVVVDVLGRELAVLADGIVGAGERSFQVTAGLPAGLYLARLSTDRGVLAMPFTVVR